MYRSIYITTPFLDFLPPFYAYRYYLLGLCWTFEDFKKEHFLAVSAPNGLKFCTCPEGDDTQNLVGAIFWISSPRKFGVPLNFAFALRPMGRKISNRHFEVDFKNTESIFSHIVARRCESLLWDFREWEKFLTRFSSIFICFTPPLIFPEPLKPARWNFYTRCTDDGANSLLSHSWLAPIGANKGGSKNWVNFGIFKNYSGGSRV